MSNQFQVKEQMAGFLSSKDDFTSWLKSKKPDDIVGKSLDPVECVLCTYIMERSPLKMRHTVFTYAIARFELIDNPEPFWLERDDRTKVLSLPDWMGAYAMALDREVASKELKPVTAAIALSVIEDLNQ
ncbi:MAG: hypothetical protein WBB28_01945 [Crinalium sp.]